MLPQRQHRPKALLAGGPQELLLALVLGELEAAPAVAAGDALDAGDVLADAGAGAGELEEQGRGLLPDARRRRPTHVDHPHLHLVHDLHRRHRHPRLHHLGRRRRRVPDRRERHHRYRGLLGHHG